MIKKLLPSVAHIFIGLFVFAPLLYLVFSVGSNFQILTAVFDPGILATLKFSLWQAAWSSVLSAIFGSMLALWLWKSGVSGDQWIQTFLIIPFGIPSLVACFTWLNILPVDLKYSLTAIVLAHVVFNTPLFTSILLNSLSKIPPSQILSVKSLGGSLFAQFKYIIWPHSRTAAATALLQVFCLCISSFAIVLILGGGPPHQSLETSLLFRIRSGVPDWNSAFAIGLWQILLTLIPWLLMARLLITPTEPHETQVPTEEPASANRIFWTRLFCAGFSLIYFVPFLISKNWMDELPYLLSSQFIHAAIQSLALALTVITLVLLLCACLFFGTKARSLKHDAFVLFSSGLSPLVIGLALWITYSNWLDPLEGSFTFIAILQGVLFLPLGYRWLAAHQGQNFDQELDAVRSLGASSWQSFWIVEWPRWRRPLGMVGALVGCASLGEVAAVSLFYSESFAPISIQLSRAMGQYQFARAELLSLLLFVLCFSLSAILARGARNP